VTAEDAKPDWWLANERDREAMDLPAYEPSRFADGVYTHEVVAELEARHDCEIRFFGRNVDWGDDWDVLIDRTPAFEVERTRDDDGNTVYRLSSAAFRERVERAVE